ncbi:Hsp70 family protein, partial [candidate division NPL-UPA2 bacterium]|nr:Hsp70 family protein [candidate division NPL-UPA2 bacterium]
MAEVKEGFLGIDLGTTMSAMATIDKMGRPYLVKNAEGDTLTPSAILIRGEERIIGRRAKGAAVAKPKNVAQFIKREMCREDFVFKDEEGNKHRPEELSALILKRLKEDAERSLGMEINKVVITVPYYFGDLERKRTRQAGEIAGLEVLEIVNEPTAAALAYGLKRQGGGNILVYDLGGGTFDTSYALFLDVRNVTLSIT